jgi:hypothetical protein
MDPSGLRRLLVSTQDPECVLWLALSAFIGIRPRELEQLNWKDILPGVRIVISPPSNTSYYYRRRTVPIHPALDAWLQPFYGTLGMVMPRRGIRRRTHRLARLLGLPLSPNILRDSYCAYRLAPINSLQQVAAEIGRDLRTVRNHLLCPVPMMATNEFFSLAPEAVGIKDWPETVAIYLNQRAAPWNQLSRRSSSKNAGGGILVKAH